MSPVKERLIQVISALPEDELPEIEHAISQVVHDPIARAIIEAQEDNEPLTAEDEEALKLADIEIREGKFRPLSELAGDQ